MANGIRLRRRLSGLVRLDASLPGLEDGDFAVLSAPGVYLGSEALAAAISHARSQDLEVLDLVPEDLPLDQALDLARVVDVATYRGNPLVPGRGALHALLVRRDVLARATPPEDDRPRPVPSRAALAGLTERLKLYAARSSDMVVVPGLQGVALEPFERLEIVRARLGKAWPLGFAIPVGRYSLLVAGLALSPGWGVAAVLAFCAEPYLALAGTALRPEEPSRSKGARLARDPVELVRTALSGRSPTAQGAGSVGPAVAAGTPASAGSPGTPASAGPAAAEDPIESRRADYEQLLANGTGEFFEAHRDTCPFCGSRRLTERLRVPDLVQCKPGEFVLDECGACGTIFQNPRLSMDGLAFYYRDFYDGLGAGEVQFLFSQAGPSYRGRVELVRRHLTPPTAWLDVGTGYGHFCLVASGLLPGTRFDGLDMGESIEEAERRRWISRAYRGLFPDLADSLQGKYDVVSMHHYLEHTRDPLAELDAAHRLLDPGRHLLIEVPDPECRFARLLGRHWVPWLQPQHQQFLSVTNLTAALEARGFSIVEVERGPAHQPIDLAGGLWRWANGLAGPPRLPWLEPPSLGRRARRMATLAAAAPFAVAAVMTDQVLVPVINRTERWSNTYRLLARRE